MSLIDLINEGKFNSSKARETPKEFIKIRLRFEEAKENNTPILIESSTLNLAQSIVIELKYVGNKWCMGTTSYNRYGEEVLVPYTISYADLYTTDPTVNTPKIVFKGANPFGRVW